MNGLMYVVLWVLPSVIVGVMVGAYLGRSTAAVTDRLLAKQEQKATLKALLALVKSTEQLTTDVDSHSSKLEDVGRTVGDLHMDGELGEIQTSLLGQISAVLQSNQQLEEDLVCARYRMEEQALELDRSRVEARTDSLSGVSNRKAFDETLRYLLLEYKHHGEAFALALADVDHFKWINDTHGHSAGDRVVSHVGSVLKQYIREGDHIARYGGDEFALLLPNTDAALAARIADRIRVIVERHNFDVGSRGARAAVTFSMGLAFVRKDDTAESILERADKALYKSKNSGRNQLYSFEAEDELVKIGA